MNLNKKILISGLVVALFSLSGCQDRAHEDSNTIKGYIYYSDGVLYGVTKDKTPNENNNYNVYGSDGGKVGAIGTNHHVIGNDLQPVAPGACIGSADAFDEDNFLVGSCTLSAPFAKDGLSAYEVAVLNGFVGTEAEWLASLEGADGTNGTNGVDGQDGTDGKDGVDGTNGVDGKDGTNALTTVTTLPVSSTYPNGAVEVKAGLDTNNNGTLDASEVTSSSIVLNGVDGTNGTNGKDGGLITPPSYLCEAGDTDPKCGINQDDFKLDALIFSQEEFATEQYNYGGTGYHDIVRGITEAITWRVESTNGIVASDFTINNLWDNGQFMSDSADFSPVKGFRLISRDGKLTIEHSDGRNATVSVDEAGLVLIDNAGLTISNNKTTKELCFTAERTACISYITLWIAK